MGRLGRGDDDDDNGGGGGGGGEMMAHVLEVKGGKADPCHVHVRPCEIGDWGLGVDEGWNGHLWWWWMVPCRDEEVEGIIDRYEALGWAIGKGNKLTAGSGRGGDLLLNPWVAMRQPYFQRLGRATGVVSEGD